MKPRYFFIVFTGLICINKLNAQRNLVLEACQQPFYHGVASGDPLHDRVIIWTRVTPDSLYNGPVVVSWRMATDTAMQNIVQQGSVLTNSNKDYTVKIDVAGLLPETYYYYEFTAFGKNSARGRTKTASLANADSLRFAVVSCANLEAGFFNVYKVIKERNDVDAVICLGDYIYEYETGGYAQNQQSGRIWQPSNEIVTLTDYRTRYSTYHLDPDLRKCHQQFPWIVVWDDHESANDSWMNGAENHQLYEGLWNDRKLAAKQAFFEWLPIRESGNPNDPYQIFRHIQYGNLLELIMLDTRLHGRDQQAGTTGSIVNSPTRQMLGSDQFTWLGNRLSNTNTQWKILAQQVMMAPLKIFGIAVNGDQWDGYPAERDRVYNYILQNNINNVVVITGDIHTSWANDLPTPTYNSNTGAGSVGVEFVTPSVTSPGLDFGVAASIIQAANSHMKYVNLTERGFIILDINQSRAQADWYYVNTIDVSSNAFSWAKSFYVNHLERFLRNTVTASFPRFGMTNIIQAPDCPRPVLQNPTHVTASPSNSVLLGLYPNPAHNEITIHFGLNHPGEIQLTITDLNGKIFSSETIYLTSSVFTYKTDVSKLSAGTYLVILKSGNEFQTYKFVKN